MNRLLIGLCSLPLFCASAAQAKDYAVRGIGLGALCRTHMQVFEADIDNVRDKTATWASITGPESGHAMMKWYCTGSEVDRAYRALDLTEEERKQFDTCAR